LLTTKDPGPVMGAIAPLAGSVNLIELLLNPGITGVDEERSDFAAGTGAEQIDRYAVGRIEALATQRYNTTLRHYRLHVVGGVARVGAGGGQRLAVD
jgi:hypothetical protein